MSQDNLKPEYQDLQDHHDLADMYLLAPTRSIQDASVGDIVQVTACGSYLEGQILEVSFVTKDRIYLKVGHTLTQWGFNKRNDQLILVSIK